MNSGVNIYKRSSYFFLSVTCSGCETNTGYSIHTIYIMTTVLCHVMYARSKTYHITRTRGRVFQRQRIQAREILTIVCVPVHPTLHRFLGKNKMIRNAHILHNCSPFSSRCFLRTYTIQFFHLISISDYNLYSLIIAYSAQSHYQYCTKQDLFCQIYCAGW